MTFKQMSDDELDLWWKLYYENFNPYDCWDAGCYCIEEQQFDDYDESLYCDHCNEDECHMFEKWKASQEI